MLSKNLISVFTLWKEYEKGLGGRKAAKLFTATKRGRIKALYHCQKVVWDTIATLVHARHTANMAIDKIYQCYGEGLSVTRIINGMLRDRHEQGGHPNLCVGTTLAQQANNNGGVWGGGRVQRAASVVRGEQQNV